MTDYGARLKEIRQKKGLNQEAFAALCGVGKHTQISYEQNRTRPTIDYLERLASAGGDVLYLLTGRRDPKLLTEEQRRLVDMYSGLNEERQRALLGKALDLYLEEGRDKPRPGQRMREGKGNTVSGKMTPINEDDKR